MSQSGSRREPCHWEEVEGLLDLPGPFIYDVSQTSIHKSPDRGSVVAPT